MIDNYVEAIHRPHLEKWLSARGMGSDICDDLPWNGYVYFHNNIPVASAHIRMCEGRVAMLDSLVTNPEAPGMIRHEAIDAVVKKCLEKAKERGVKHVLAYSIDENTIRRSKKFGFINLQHTLIGLNLGE